MVAGGHARSRRRGRGRFRLHKFRMPARVLGVRLITWFVVVLMLAMPTFMASPTALGFGRLPANSTIAGVNVSRIYPEDAERILSSVIQAAYAREFSISILGVDHTYTPADIGLVFDTSTVLQHLMSTGTGGAYDLDVHLDPARFQFHVESLRSWLPEPARNARVEITGTQVDVVPGIDGQTFDIGAYRNEVLRNAFVSDPFILLDVLSYEPDISTEDAQLVADEVNQLLQQPLVLTAGNSRWEITPQQYAPAIVISPTSNGEFGISWDLDPLHPYINEIVTEIEATERRDAWIQDLGSHSWLVPERGSMVVDTRLLITNVNTALIAGEHMIEVPIDLIPAAKTTEDVMAELGITGIIASGDSIYTGSGGGRKHNVETAAYYIDRTLVPPGGTFSFNDAVGSLFTGEYLSAGSYIDGPNGTSLAGGVCQVSTTVFRAALNAGFPIVERWPHSYRSPFYELGGWSPGFDAAIVQDSGAPHESTDLRFTNPTNSWLMITAETDGDRMVVSIWGENTGYAVSYMEPSISLKYHAPVTATVMVDDQLPTGTMERQDPMDGLAVTITRYVYGRDGNLVLSDTWHTTYYATGPILRVSPDMEDEAFAMTST